jgi:hypothetical protein
MNLGMHRAEIGQWYLRRDTGEVFLVTGQDDRSRTIEIQAIDGDLDEMEIDTWGETPLECVEPPGDANGPLDNVEVNEDEDSDSVTQIDWSARWDPSIPVKEAWEDTTAQEEIDSYTERADPLELH